MTTGLAVIDQAAAPIFCAKSQVGLMLAASTQKIPQTSRGLFNTRFGNIAPPMASTFATATLLTTRRNVRVFTVVYTVSALESVFIRKK